MATISLQFNGEINTSVSVGDFIYYSNPTSNYQESGFNVSNNTTFVGNIQSISFSNDVTTIVSSLDTNNPPPTSISYIYFSKEKQVNTGSLRGYYGKLKFRNNSKMKAELYASSCVIEQSSK
jgi:hypothetical protein